MAARPAKDSTSTPELPPATLRGRAYRRLTDPDLPSLRKLLGRSVPGDYILPMSEAWLHGGIILGAWEGDELVAVQRLDAFGAGEAWIGGIRVAPERRRLGIGRDLMEYTLQLCAPLEVRWLRLFIEEGNAASQSLARAEGFHQVLDVAHLAGTVCPDHRPAPSEVLRALPPDDLAHASWVEAFGGFLIPAIRHSNHAVRATRNRFEEEVRRGTLRRVPGTRTTFLLSGPEPVTWSDRPLRAFSPIEGPLEEILNAVAGLTKEDQALVDGFLPVGTSALETATARGLVRGALWGTTIGLYERDVGGRGPGGTFPPR